MRTQILFFAALLLLTNYSFAQFDDLEPFDTMPDTIGTLPDYDPIDDTFPDDLPDDEPLDTEPTTPVEPVSKPETVSTPTLDLPPLPPMPDLIDPTTTTTTTEPEPEIPSELPEPDDGDGDGDDDDKDESEGESDDGDHKDSDKPSDKSDDEHDPMVTELTPNLLEGTWYVYNSTGGICCVPTGTVEFYSVGGTAYIDTNFEGLSCEMRTPSTTFSLSLTDSYTELPKYTNSSETPETGYDYYVSGFSYGNFWPNNTQQVLLSMESLSGVDCSFTLSMSAETIYEKTQ